MSDITSFSGNFEFLSNFYRSTMLIGKERYPTVEHAYQAEKTLDPKLRMHIRIAGTPGEAKERGRAVALRPDWEAIKLAVMRKLIGIKFKHPHLRNLLVKTYPRILIEGNHWHDNFWGACTCEHCVDVRKENMLGRLLMKEREKYIPKED